jgi:hypothetical protein
MSERPATEKQIRYIRKLSKDLGRPEPSDTYLSNLRVWEASTVIDDLKSRDGSLASKQRKRAKKSG